MPNDTDIDEQLNGIGEGLRRQPSVRGEVMRRVTNETMRPSRSSWRFVGRAAALAACAAVVVAVLSMRGGPVGLGATEAFAAAIASVGNARTFSAISTSRHVDDAGKEHVTRTTTMYKEPSFERMETVVGAGHVEVMIRDYAKRKELRLHGKDKSAALVDLSTLYSVDLNTGKTALTELRTFSRDDVVRLTASAVKDVGEDKLDGKDVRVLRSDDGKDPVRTVWVDKKSGKPLKVEIVSSSGKSSFTYSSIKLDEPLDDALFTFDLPAGYAFEERFKEIKPLDPKSKEFQDHYGKMLAKMKYVMEACYRYFSKFDGEFPESLADLKKAGIKESALKALLAAPDEPNGEPIVEYRKPRKGKDAGTEIVVYEKAEFRRKGHVAVGMADGHGELLTDERFEELMKE